MLVDQIQVIDHQMLVWEAAEALELLDKEVKIRLVIILALVELEFNLQLLELEHTMQEAEEHQFVVTGLLVHILKDQAV